jgi:hypothetical protein
VNVNSSSPSWDYQQQVQSEDRMRESIHAAYVSIATSTLDRMIRRADSVIKVSAAAGTIYTTILGLNYTYGDSVGFTPWALVPAALFAASLTLGATYVGYVQTAPSTFQPLATALSAEVQHKRLDDLIGWVNSIALRRVWALRTSIAALGFGVASMPVAFVNHHEQTIAIAAIAGTAAWVSGELVVQLRSR